MSEGFRPVQLLGRDGEYVTTVKVPPIQPAEVIQWMHRIFVRSERGEYREGAIWIVLEGEGVMSAGEGAIPAIHVPRRPAAGGKR